MIPVSLSWASLGTLLLLLVIPPPPSFLYVNDASTEQDRFTQQPGNDLSGDGSPERPYATLQKALEHAFGRDTIFVDAGLYPIDQSIDIKTDAIRIIGTPDHLTRFRADDIPILRAEQVSGLLLRDLVLEGGRAGVAWKDVAQGTMERVVSLNATAYGILLRDCQDIRLIGCVTMRSQFRGLQLERSSGILVESHRSAENANGGIVLNNSGNNILRACRSEKNGMSGFFLFRASSNNQFWECLALDNKFVGFYLFEGSTRNALRGCISRGNERGVTATGSPNNRFERTTVEDNHTFGFLFKDNSPGNQLARNRVLKNPSGDLATSPDSPVRIGFRNQINRRVVYNPGP